MSNFVPSIHYKATGPLLQVVFGYVGTWVRIDLGAHLPEYSCTSKQALIHFDMSLGTHVPLYSYLGTHVLANKYSCTRVPHGYMYFGTRVLLFSCSADLINVIIIVGIIIIYRKTWYDRYNCCANVYCCIWQS